MHRIVAALVTVAMGLATASIPVASASANSTPTPATLRELAARDGIVIGSGAINPNYLDEPQFSEVLADQFNSLSPENELKWNFVQPQEGSFDFAGLDRLVDFAEDNNMVVKGHGFISGCCNPDYVTAITDADELRTVMSTHFNTIMDRYAGKMDRWDVVTEPFSIAGGTGLVHNDFYKVLGADYIAEAFRIAHAADPQAKLFINESLVEFYPEKRQELYDLVAGLVADGVPIDGVGFEMHETQAGPEPGIITQMTDSYHALGLDVAITELDVHTYDVDQQTQIYGDVVAEALAAGIRDISFWGFTDKHAYTWLPGAKPLMFNEDYNPKPAYFAVRDALQNFVQSTSAPGTATLSNTSRQTHGHHDGNYSVTMHLRHGTQGSFYRLYENGKLISARVPDPGRGTTQSVETTFKNKPKGTYVYRAELINSKGITATNTTSVTVCSSEQARPKATSPLR
ncbi:endo-1,4-beta-xylanase [Streptomyces sp. WI04-05B]|uniref:endo-1,4-beta-xylanase n=1 Tax=Streptomyces TaxID=1883 RepID=UPI0029A2FBFC|nr:MULTISPECIES: endo-1,4-beta-xylanase [unclassified Streptomyces]MDX2546886.1 endo-1,4-beta-xylanase [Streptomyces sp. WI04-05B]MDX2589683.1 endo-1,4-beta-xylanase [Streptomyces sp. WI04-05A]